MIFQFDNFHQSGIRIHADCFQACLFDLFQVFVVEFIAMTMTFLNG